LIAGSGENLLSMKVLIVHRGVLSVSIKLNL